MSYEYSCAAAGASTCGLKVLVQSEEELRAVLADHLAKKHKIADPSETIIEHLLASVNRSHRAR